MIPRGVLDIEWPTLLTAVPRSVLPVADVHSLCERVERLWDEERESLVCYSVRSGLDAVLTSTNWPAGSEILTSAVTIPDMVRIIHKHSFIAVPVNVDPNSLAPDLEQLQSRMTSKTRAILVAHLFGSRLELSELRKFADRRNLELWEDVAQGFAADGYPGDRQADISFFSFGLIKTQTALGGAILRFRDACLAAKCRRLQASWKQQSSQGFRNKILRAILLKLLGSRVAFTAACTASLFGVDLDDWLSRSSRAFDQSGFFEQLRQRPSAALAGLLHCRLVHPHRNWLDRKNELAVIYRQKLPAQVVLGASAQFPTHWVQAIISHHPDQLITRLRTQGYDATSRGSQLRAIPAPASHPDWTTTITEAWVSRLVFLPLHPALNTRRIAEIAATVTEFESGSESIIPWENSRAMIT